jgi:hypothetical protein
VREDTYWQFCGRVQLIIYCKTPVKGLDIQEIGQQKVPGQHAEPHDRVETKSLGEKKPWYLITDHSGLSGWNRAPSDADVSPHHVMQDGDRDYAPGNDFHRGCMSYLNTGSHWQREKENLNDANR